VRLRREGREAERQAEKREEGERDAVEEAAEGGHGVEGSGFNLHTNED
jgi:hypothetical protein